MNLVQVTRKFALVALCALVAVAFACGTALADDHTPPPWRDLGWQYSAQFEWDWPGGDASAAGASPQVASMQTAGLGDDAEATFTNMNPFFGPVAMRAGWTVESGETGQIDLFLPNFADFEPRKEIRVQLRFTILQTAGVLLTDNDMPSIIDVGGEDTTGGGGVVTDISVHDAVWDVTEENDAYAPGSTLHFVNWYQDVTMRPNPDWERLSISVPDGFVGPFGGIFVHQIFVDTISIPEPGSAVMAGLAVIGLVGVARRRRT